MKVEQVDPLDDLESIERDARRGDYTCSRYEADYILKPVREELRRLRWEAKVVPLDIWDRIGELTCPTLAAECASKPTPADGVAHLIAYLDRVQGERLDKLTAANVRLVNRLETVKHQARDHRKKDRNAPLETFLECSGCQQDVKVSDRIGHLCPRCELARLRSEVERLGRERDAVVAWGEQYARRHRTATGEHWAVMAKGHAGLACGQTKAEAVRKAAGLGGAEGGGGSPEQGRAPR